MKNIVRTVFLAAAALMLATGCQSVKPYEKEYLVHPLMEDSYTGDFDSSLTGRTAGKMERMKVGGGAGGSSSCPTCGG